MPLYQTKSDREVEKMVSTMLIKHGWDASVTKTICPWDIEAIKPPLFMAKKERRLLIEVKRRKFEWGRWPTVFIDVKKVEDIMAEARRDEKRATVGVFVVVPNDGQPRFTWLTTEGVNRWRMNTTDVQSHRNDPNDRGDLKYDIPLLDFHPLSLL